MRPPWRETFASGKKAAERFYKENADFFRGIQDAGEGVREFFGNFDIRGRRASETKEAQDLLSRRGDSAKIKGALAMIFRQAKGNRWDAVQWEDVRSLEASLSPLFEPYAGEPQNPGLYWYPMASLDGDVDRMSGDQLNEFYAWQSRARIVELVSRLRASLTKNGKHLAAWQRKIVRSRIREWTRWAKDPSKIPSYACEPDRQSGGMMCDYPEIEGELRRLNAASREPYHPGWAEAYRGRPGFQDELAPGEIPFMPIAAYEDEDGGTSSDRCTIAEAARTLGRASARKRKKTPRKAIEPTQRLIRGRLIRG